MTRINPQHILLHHFLSWVCGAVVLVALLSATGCGRRNIDSIGSGGEKGGSASTIEDAGDEQEEGEAGGEETEETADGEEESGGTEEVVAEAEDDVELEPYDPPSLEEIDAKANWIDNPVRNHRQILRDRLEEEQAQLQDPNNLNLKNTSDETNAKILNVMRQLPASDDEVDWDATFVHYVGSDARSLNHLMINSTYEFELLELTGLQLIGFDNKFTPHAVGWAVKSWQTSEDHMMDKFVLRDDLTWSDGKPLTAHDVVFSFQTIMNPKVPIPAVRSQTRNLRWVHAYDDHTVVIFQREAMASWTENLQFPIIPKHIYEQGLEEDPTLENSDYHLKFLNKPVTCGPYEYTKRIRNQEIVLTRRDDWYQRDGKEIREKPFCKEIRFRVINDPNTALLALKSGQIHDCVLTAEQWITQTGDDEFYKDHTKLNGLEWTEFHIEWNCESKFFNDKRVRQAMAYAMDHEEMLSSIFYDLAPAGRGVFHPEGWMASKKPQPYKQNLDKAEDLLDAAGWVDSDGDGIRDKRIGGRLVPFEFTLVSYDTPNPIKVCTLLKENLDQIGITCHVKPTEFTVKADLAIKHKFDALMGGWGTGTDPATLDNIFKTGGGRNHGNYSNPKVDRLFEQAAVEFDREKRAALYAEIHDILWEEQPYLWLFYRPSLYALSKDLRGFNFSPRDPYGVQPGLHGIWFLKR